MPLWAPVLDYYSWRSSLNPRWQIGRYFDLRPAEQFRHGFRNLACLGIEAEIGKESSDFAKDVQKPDQRAGVVAYHLPSFS